MDFTTVLSSAVSLKRHSLYKVTIAEHTREILMQLNSAIVTAHGGGRTMIVYKLPINFPRVDDAVTNQELQTAIYYNVITELERKDYVVQLEFRPKFTIITVSWSVKTATNELKRMRDKILSLRVSN